MNRRQWLGSAWFWAAVLLASVAVGVFGYTLYLRQAAEGQVRDKLQAGQELLDVLKGIHDQEDMLTALPKLRELQKQEQAHSRRLPDWLQPSLRLKEELSQRYARDFENLLKEMAEQERRITKLPGGKEFWEELEKMQQYPVWSFTY